MSDIPRARMLLNHAADIRRQIARLLDELDTVEAKALELLDRVRPVRRATPIHVEKTDEMIAQVHQLSRDPDLTMHEISDMVGLRNGGRVSEILKRPRQ